MHVWTKVAGWLQNSARPSYGSCAAGLAESNVGCRLNEPPSHHQRSRAGQSVSVVRDLARCCQRALGPPDRAIWSSHLESGTCSVASGTRRNAGKPKHQAGSSHHPVVEPADPTGRSAGEGDEGLFLCASVGVAQGGVAREIKHVPVAEYLLLQIFLAWACPCKPAV